MTTPHFRALVSRMADELDHYRIEKEGDDTSHPLAAEARAALAVEPEPPADGEVAELVAWLWTMRELAGEHNPDEQCRYERAADLLERLAPQPVPVSERLPEAKDCDVEGQCWWFDSDDEKWCLDNLYKGVRLLCWTHWLPANALPLPAEEV